MNDAKPKWLNYSNQSVDELLSLASEYQIDSLVFAFEQALHKKAARVGEENLSEEERLVLGIEALEREVHNGGYEIFFFNSSRIYTPMIVDWLMRIGCSKTAAITAHAIEILGSDDLSPQTLRLTAAVADEARDKEHDRCDREYYKTGEDIGGRLFAYIQANKHAITF